MDHIYKSRTPYFIFMITLLGVMGVASITPAFPAIIEHFGLEKKEVAYLITAFSVPGIFLSPITGILADRFGRKTIIVPSLFLFAIAGSACFFANSFDTLLIFRFFQGLGAASLGSLNITLIGDLYQGPSRARLMGMNAAILSIGTATYPLFGGFLASVSWEWVFILPSLGFIAGFVILLFLKNAEPQEHQDLKSYFSNVWKTVNQRSVWGIFFINILLFFVLYGAFLSFLPSFLHENYGAESRMIGFIMSLASLSTALVSANIAKVRNILSARQRLIAGGIGFLISMLLIALSHSLIIIILAMLVFGIGQGIIMPSLQTILVSYASLKERAAFMSINGMVLRIGQSLGPMVISIFYLGGNIRLTFYAGAVSALLLISIVMFWIKELKES